MHLQHLIVQSNTTKYWMLFLVLRLRIEQTQSEPLIIFFEESHGFDEIWPVCCNARWGLGLLSQVIEVEFESHTWRSIPPGCDTPTILALQGFLGACFSRRSLATMLGTKSRAQEQLLLWFVVQRCHLPGGAGILGQQCLFYVLNLILQLLHLIQIILQLIVRFCYVVFTSYIACFHSCKNADESDKDVRIQWKGCTKPRLFSKYFTMILQWFIQLTLISWLGY